MLPPAGKKPHTFANMQECTCSATIETHRQLTAGSALRLLRPVVLPGRFAGWVGRSRCVFSLLTHCRQRLKLSVKSACLDKCQQKTRGERSIFSWSLFTPALSHLSLTGPQTFGGVQLLRATKEAPKNGEGFNSLHIQCVGKCFHVFCLCLVLKFSTTHSTSCITPLCENATIQHQKSRVGYKFTLFIRHQKVMRRSISYLDPVRCGVVFPPGGGCGRARSNPPRTVYHNRYSPIISFIIASPPFCIHQRLF